MKHYLFAILMGTAPLCANIDIEDKKSIELVEINEQNFKEILKTNKRVILDVYAPWCGPCKRLAPILAELSEELTDRYTFVKLDGTENRELMKKLKIKGFPTIVLFKKGKEVKRNVGFINKEDLSQLIVKKL